MREHNPEAFKRYLELQMEHMMRHKFFLSEAAGEDLGEKALEDFVKKYSKQFREEWESGKWCIDKNGACLKDQETSANSPTLGDSK
jgi:hypothetical protein